MPEPTKIATTLKIFCNVCSRPNNHNVESSYKTTWDDEDAGVWGGAVHDFLRCNGCDTPTIRSTTWFSENPGELPVHFTPPRATGDERKPKRFDNIPWGSRLESVYRQTLSAFTQQLFTLAGAGVRLVIEGVCKELGIKKGRIKDSTGKFIKDQGGKFKLRDTLEGKINSLALKKHITIPQAKMLHEIRFLGNDAAHALDQPTEKTVLLALDIAEHLLEQVFEQPEKAKASCRTQATHKIVCHGFAQKPRSSTSQNGKIPQ